MKKNVLIFGIGFISGVIALRIYAMIIQDMQQKQISKTGEQIEINK